MGNRQWLLCQAQWHWCSLTQLKSILNPDASRFWCVYFVWWSFCLGCLSLIWGALPTYWKEGIFLLNQTSPEWSTQLEYLLSDGNSLNTTIATESQRQHIGVCFCFCFCFGIFIREQWEERGKDWVPEQRHTGASFLSLCWTSLATRTLPSSCSVAFVRWSLCPDCPSEACAMFPRLWGKGIVMQIQHSPPRRTLLECLSSNGSFL